MTEKLQEIIKEEAMKLPKEIQEAISSFDWVKITEEIGNKFFLDETELNDFQAETLLVLVGLVDPEFYAVNIENHVNTTTEKARNLADEALERIFAPINKILEENIKKNLKNKSPNWQQSINFILTGGDYSTLIAPARSENVNEEKENQTSVRPPTLQDIKDKLLIAEK